MLPPLSVCRVYSDAQRPVSCCTLISIVSAELNEDCGSAPGVGEAGGVRMHATDACVVFDHRLV